MRWIRQFDLFLFDMDGLLVDTEKLHYRAYQILCERNRATLPFDFPEYLKVAHLSDEGLKQALLPLLGGGEWSEHYEEKKKLYMELIASGEITLMPGVEKLLDSLSVQKIKRCVVTHSSKEQVSVIKKALPILNTIPLWVTREDYDAAKPAPDGYLKAIELLADPGDAIVGFEDSFRGFSALKGTYALPVLICDPAHPQLRLDALKDAIHFSSFSSIPKTFSKEPS